MKKVVLLVFSLVVVCALAAQAEARVVLLRSTSSGTYEEGVFTPGDKDVFQGKFLVDEDTGVVETLEVVKSDREGRTQSDAAYEVTNAMVGEGLSAFTVQRDKMGQRVITSVRDDEVGKTELLIIGERFYEYCAAVNGRFYLESGEVQDLRQ